MKFPLSTSLIASKIISYQPPKNKNKKEISVDQVSTFWCYVRYLRSANATNAHRPPPLPINQSISQSPIPSPFLQKPLSYTYMRLLLPSPSLKIHFTRSISLPSFPHFPLSSSHRLPSSEHQFTSSPPSFSSSPSSFHRHNSTTLPPILSFKRFLLRQRVLALYRSILRATASLPRTSTTRAEVRKYARDEFERNRGVEDEGKIRFLVRVGKEDLGRLGLKG